MPQAARWPAVVAAVEGADTRWSAATAAATADGGCSGGGGGDGGDGGGDGGGGATTIAAGMPVATCMGAVATTLTPRKDEISATGRETSVVAAA